MKVIIQPTAEAVSQLAARYMCSLVLLNPQTVLGLQPGREPGNLYAELGRMHQEEGVDFSSVTTFNLDEYVGLPPAHPSSRHEFMREHLFSHINVSEERINVPDGRLARLPHFCQIYEQAIQDAGGIDLQVLGLSRDGHLGFNGRDSSPFSLTHLKVLGPPPTLPVDGSPPEPQPLVRASVITMGLGTIMQARQILLLACGEDKAEAVAEAIEGAVNSHHPASTLQRHVGVRFLLDEAAASKLTYREHFKVWPAEEYGPCTV